MRQVVDGNENGTTTVQGDPRNQLAEVDVLASPNVSF